MSCFSRYSTNQLFFLLAAKLVCVLDIRGTDIDMPARQGTGCWQLHLPAKRANHANSRVAPCKQASKRQLSAILNQMAETFQYHTHNGLKPHILNLFIQIPTVEFFWDNLG